MYRAAKAQTSELSLLFQRAVEAATKVVDSTARFALERENCKVRSER